MFWIWMKHILLGKQHAAHPKKLRFEFSFDCWVQANSDVSGEVCKECGHAKLYTYSSAMLFNCLLCQRIQFVAIQLSRTGSIFLLSVCGWAVMLPEKLSCFSIATQLHLSQLDPRPIRVQICRSHKRQMHAQVPMYCWAIDAYKYTVRHRWPCRILCTAIEARLKVTTTTTITTQKLNIQFDVNHPLSATLALQFMAHVNRNWQIEIGDDENFRICWKNVVTLFVAWARSRLNTASISTFDGPFAFAIFPYILCVFVCVGNYSSARFSKTISYGFAMWK